jgi:two-component system, LytTR family, response regulator
MSGKIRVIVADDERPARSFLTTTLKSLEDVDVVGEAENGQEAVGLIQSEQPDLALLDLQMPGMDGLSIVRALKKGHIPLIAFVTAHDEYAIQAFDIEAIDYLLKPVDRTRLRRTIKRAQERLEQEDAVAGELEGRPVVQDDGPLPQQDYLERLPIKKKDDIIFLQVNQIASIVSDGELMHITTLRKERYTISHRLKALEARLDPRRFVRLGRGTLVNVDTITRVTNMPGGSYLVTLTNTQQLRVSRSQSRFLRQHILRL